MTRMTSHAGGGNVHESATDPGSSGSVHRIIESVRACETPIPGASDDSDRRWNIIAIVLAAVVPGYVHVFHFVSGTISIPSAVLGCGIGVVLSVGLLLLAIRAYSCSDFFAPGKWTLAGLGLGLTVSVLTVTQQMFAGGTIIDPVYFSAAAGTYGAVGGYAAGFYRSYARDQSTKADNFFELFDTLPHPAVRFVIDDGTPQVQQGNRAFTSVFGIENTSIHGQSVNQLVCPPNSSPDSVSWVEDWMDTDGRIEIARQVETEQGIQYFDLYAFPTSTRTSSDAGILIMINVTDRRRREQRVAVLNRVLRHDLRSKGQLITGYTEMLAEGRTSRAEATDMIEDSVDELLQIGSKSRTIERMLQQGHSSPDQTDLTHIVEQTVADCRERLSGPTIRLKTPDTAFGYADERLATVLTELIENAVEHAWPGDAEDDRSERNCEPVIEITVQENVDTVSITVADNGTGIPEMERVAHTGEESKLEHSSGIGLWMVNWVVDDFGGTVEFGDGSGGIVTINLLAV